MAGIGILEAVVVVEEIDTVIESADVLDLAVPRDATAVATETAGDATKHVTRYSSSSATIMASTAFSTHDQARSASSSVMILIREENWLFGYLPPGHMVCLHFTI